MSPNAKPERQRECVEVKTVSPTHLRLTATTTKSAFCALHGLHEIKLTRRRR